MSGGGALSKKGGRFGHMVGLNQLVMRLKPLRLRGRHPVAPGQLSRSDSGDGGGGSSGRSVPPGFLAVYIGPERRRFVIPTRFLNLPVFSSLLKLAEEEFGFRSAGGLVLPCEVELFRRVLEALEMDEDRFGGFGLDGFLDLFSSSSSSSSCKESSTATSAGAGGGFRNEFSSLLRKARV